MGQSQGIPLAVRKSLRHAHRCGDVQVDGVQLAAGCGLMVEEVQNNRRQDKLSAVPLAPQNPNFTHLIKLKPAQHPIAPNSKHLAPALLLTQEARQEKHLIVGVFLHSLQHQELLTTVLYLGPVHGEFSHG